ncbi:sensor domain-containing protein [Kutzneria buriramensis]|uniref:Putative sensor protein n=1 Tax=Kutzneria buriramensis TaxID=1045776 RepID=A0A3E0HPL0_9PSEU|nr:sensor domain-containing protein [Kutzneria buriramensis]REH48473.1 putative sensor protein [Kutzneria buriramensis]
MSRAASAVRLPLTRAPWAATAYLGSYLALGPALFVATVVVVAVACVLSISWLGFPLLVGAAGIVRGCADIERWRTRLVAEPITGGYLAVGDAGVFTQLRVRWTDPATRRDCGYLMALMPALLLLDAATMLLWLTLLAGITVPLWFWTIPQTWPDGRTEHGLHIAPLGIWLGDLPSALVFAAVCVVLAAAASHLVVAVAALHARVARALLGPATDPLAAAKRVLAEPGPLPPWRLDQRISRST